MNNLYTESKMILVNQAAIMSTLNLLLSSITTIPIETVQKQSLMLSEMCTFTNRYVTEFVDKTDLDHFKDQKQRIDGDHDETE